MQHSNGGTHYVCRFCGTPLRDDSIFCQSCGKSIETQPSTVQTSEASDPAKELLLPDPKHQNGTKKFLATILIVIFSLMLLTQNASKIPKEADLGYLMGRLCGIALVVAGFILSVKWQIKLSGFTKTSGRQAVAIFLIVFCTWGLFLVLMLGIAEIGSNSREALLIPTAMGIAYIAGLYWSVRWIKRLRLSEHEVANTTGTTLSKGATN
jgi:hypothetical protein